MTVNYNTYDNEKMAFIRKHGKKYDWKVETSPMDQYGVYYKTYIFENGACWYERMSPAYRSKEVETEIEGITVKATIGIKLFETEFWSSDDPNSKKYYEKF